MNTSKGFDKTDIHSSYLIGLAGQSCAGKNTAAEIFARQGLYVIDADAVSREVLRENAVRIIQTYEPIAKSRGQDIRLPDGSLNSHALGILLFSDTELLVRHEAFMLPMIEERIRLLIRNREDLSRPVILNAPTLHKTALVRECRFIFYIEAPYFLRFLRCVKRDRLSWRAVFLRFLRQKDFLSQYLLQNADIIRVKNRGSAACLEKKIMRILDEKNI